MVCQHSTIPN